MDCDISLSSFGAMIMAGSLALVPAMAPAAATVVTISAGPAGNGCTVCYNGPDQLHYGEVVTLDNDGTGPNQMTLGAGTYRITNAATAGTYSAWRFNDAGGDNWAWSFIFGSDNGDGTATVLDYGYVAGVFPDRNSAAGASDVGTYDINGEIDPHGSTADYSTTFTLPRVTTLDFFMDDGYLPDNIDGVALNITPASSPAVPEPATWATMLGGFGLVGGAMRSRRAPKAFRANPG